MGVEKDNYENPSVSRVVANVHAGVRTKEDLELCGCSVCREALRRLGVKREIITDGWCKGNEIVDGIIMDDRAGKPAFNSKFNEEAVDQLRRHGLVKEVSE